MTLFGNFRHLIALGFESFMALKLTIFERNRVLKVIHPISNYDEFRVLPLKFKALPHKLYYMKVASPSCNYEYFSFK